MDVQYENGMSVVDGGLLWHMDHYMGWADDLMCFFLC